jgi:hypothetical protein
MDGNGGMSSKEFKILLNDIAITNNDGSISDSNPQTDDDDNSFSSSNSSSSSSSSSMSDDDLNLFIASMDGNGDGKLGRDEFVDYCMRGMNMSQKQRSEFSKRSAMHSKLQLFISNILRRIENERND